MALQLIVEEERCSGCRACQLACSQAHDGVFSLALARLRVLKYDADGIDRPIICRFCPEAPCVAACLAGALTQSPNRSLHLDTSLCQTCGLCVQACPYDVLRLHPQTGRPLYCDLCGGEPTSTPACVTACATGALGVKEGG